MDYLSENCYLSTLNDNNEMDLFHCGDADQMISSTMIVLRISTNCLEKRTCTD